MAHPIQEKANEAREALDEGRETEEDFQNLLAGLIFDEGISDFAITAESGWFIGEAGIVLKTQNGEFAITVQRLR